MFLNKALVPIAVLFMLFFPRPIQAADYLKVTRVVDGDTIVLETGEKVRLIGVDTPEVHERAKLHKDAERSQRDVQTIRELGKKAWEFTTKLVKGKHVRLEFDQANAHTNHKDRYGRTLAYVYLQDGTFLKAEIIRQGYGHAYTKYPFAYADEFRRYEREAREQGRGLWKEW
jgi:micrococcal nuclease